ncbi:MAG: DUF1761 family protein [Flavobacteriales bacterium]|nr:DUF1761 family protein [Flavobacteriales bacterium]
MNFLPILGAALIPTVVGFIWYNPKVFGTAWMKAAEMTEEKMKGANMAVVFGVSLLLSVMLSFVLQTVVIHQMHIYSALMNVMDQPQAQELLKTFMDNYGTEFRTFKHGALHGTIAGIFIVLPVLGTNALFERKGWKYILVNVGYWTVTLALMGGVVCQWA